MTGNDVKKARLKAGFNLRQLGEKWGFNRQTISFWEDHKDDEVPNPKMVKFLVNSLNAETEQKNKPGSVLLTGNDLRDFRNGIGFTQSQLASIWGFTKQTICNWEAFKGGQLPNPKMVKILIDSFDRLEANNG